MYLFSPGGAPRTSALIKQYKTAAEADGNEACVLHAGDALTGTIFYSLLGIDPDVQYLNAIGFDALAVGNHEFDDGDTNLANFTRSLNFPVISYNRK